MSIASEFSSLTPRDKRVFIGVAALLVFNVPMVVSSVVNAYNTTQRLGGWERIWKNHQFLQAEAQLPQAIPNVPSPQPRPGEEGGPAYLVNVFTVRHHGYLMKPAGMRCQGGTLIPTLYSASRDSEALAIKYWDKGDRWVFDIAVKYPTETVKAQADITVGCEFGGHPAQPDQPNPLGIRPRPTDRSA